jgi:acyl carrier protein
VEAGVDRRQEWDRFAAAVAEAARVDPAAIEPHTRLLEDLGLDSLSLTEVVVALMVDFEMQALSEELEQRDWNGVTVGELYDEYRAAG